MANTYTQILIQYVFAVRNRESLIKESFRVPMEKYISGIISNKGHKMLGIYFMPDHCHILVGLNPSQSISDLARDIKSNTTKWVNEHIKMKFNWQEGYGAFSYGKSQLDMVVNYIYNQPEHHKRTSFREEYVTFLKKFNVPFEDQYMFRLVGMRCRSYRA